MSSDIKEQYLEQGHLKDVLMIDQHLHCGQIGYFYTGGNDYTEVTQNLQRQNIRWGIVSDINSYQGLHHGNDRVIELIDRWPNQYKGAIYMNENDCEDPNAEIDRCLKTKKFVSFKVHPAWAGAQIDSSFYEEIYKIAGDLHFPVLVHTWGEQDVIIMKQLAKRHPATNFLIGHCGGDLGAARLSAQIAAINKNLYLDFTCSWAYAGLLEYLVKTAGSECILFGSDALWNSVDAALGRIIFAQITDEEKRNVLGLNAQNLFNIH